MYVPHLDICTLNAQEVVCVCLCVRMYVCMYVCMYVFISLYIYIYIHIYIYTGSMCMSVYLIMFYLPRKPQACMPGCIRAHVYLLVWMMMLA